MRHFFDKEAKKQGFKGSVLVVFVNPEKAKEFLELPEVKFKGIQLLRKWHQDYVEEKRKEIEERKAKKEAKRKKDEDASQEVGKCKLGEVDFSIFLLFLPQSRWDWWCIILFCIYEVILALLSFPLHTFKCGIGEQNISKGSRITTTSLY